MEESQQVKKLKNLKSIVLWELRTLLWGQHSKEKTPSFPKTRKKKPVKPSVRVMSKTKTRDQKICLSEFYLL